MGWWGPSLFSPHAVILPIIMERLEKLPFMQVSPCCCSGRGTVAVSWGLTLLFPCSGSGFSMRRCRCCYVVGCEYLNQCGSRGCLKSPWKKTPLRGGWQSCFPSNLSSVTLGPGLGPCSWGCAVPMLTPTLLCLQPAVHGAGSLCPVPSEMVPVHGFPREPSSSPHSPQPVLMGTREEQDDGLSVCPLSPQLPCAG